MLETKERCHSCFVKEFHPVNVMLQSMLTLLVCESSGLFCHWIFFLERSLSQNASCGGELQRQPYLRGTYQFVNSLLFFNTIKYYCQHFTLQVPGIKIHVRITGKCSHSATILKMFIITGSNHSYVAIRY